MPYKDKERQREYQKEWYRRKKLGLNTKIVGKNPTLTPEEKLRRQKINSKKYRARIKKELKENFKNKCFICDKTIETGNYHEKHGKEHPCSIAYINKNKDDFIYLCAWCHRFIHVLMDLTKWDWNKIERFILKHKSNI